MFFNICGNLKQKLHVTLKRFKVNILLVPQKSQKSPRPFEQDWH